MVFLLYVLPITNPKQRCCVPFLKRSLFTFSFIIIPCTTVATYCILNLTSYGPSQVIKVNKIVIDISSTLIPIRHPFVFVCITTPHSIVSRDNFDWMMMMDSILQRYLRTTVTHEHSVFAFDIKTTKTM